MPKEVLTCRAGDNVYLHRDFHGALSCGLDYLHRIYGAEAVRDYLRGFTLAFYAPLREEIKSAGLGAIRRHYEKVYQIENGEIEFSKNEEELLLRVRESPAVKHLRAQGYPVATLFHETVKTVNEALCEGTCWATELVEYDEQTGRSVQRFYRRES